MNTDILTDSNLLHSAICLIVTHKKMVAEGMNNAYIYLKLVEGARELSEVCFIRTVILFMKALSS